MRDYKDIEKDYPPVEHDVMEDSDDRERVIRDIILMYADCGSLRKLGQRLGCSHMTARNQVVRIRQIILDEYNKTQ